MTWKYAQDGSTLLGVPARDLSDDEYEKYAAEFEAREGVQLASTGFYVKDEAKKAAKAATSEGE